MIRGLMGDTLSVVRSATTGKDRFGKPVTSETGRRRYPARIQRRTSEEGREFVTNQWVAYLPRSADVLASDSVEWDALRFEVDGSPEPREIPGFPALAHLRVYLVQREGS